MSATAESYGTTLALDIAPVIEPPLNRARMERALVNLISNAIEAMLEGGQVRISAQFVAGSVVVHVDDTGPGVAPHGGDLWLDIPLVAMRASVCGYLERT